MIFSSHIKDLTEAVNKVTLALPLKAADPRYENVAMKIDYEKLYLFSTDGDVEMSTFAKISSKDVGAISVQAKKIQDTLKSLYDTEAEFNIDKKDSDKDYSLIIKTDRGKYMISARKALDERHKEKLNYNIAFKLGGLLLKDLINKTLFATSKDSMRLSMTGVLLEIEPGLLRFVATDGHRLVKLSKQHETGAEKNHQIIIPSRVLNIVDKLIVDEDVQISIDTENLRISFETNNTILVASLISESYPNYEAVIPLENDKKLLVNRSNLLSSVKRVSQFSSRGDIRLNIEQNSVDLSAENIDEGASAEETLTCDYSNESIKIGFNSKFLEESLTHIETEEIEFEFSTSTRATIIKPIYDKEPEEDLLMLIMPVRINV